MWPRFVSTPYFKYFLSFACLLLFFALSASPTMAVMTTSFEESEGYSHGDPLEGQLGWYKLGGLGGTTTVENIGGYTGWNTLYTTTTNYNYNGFYHEFATSTTGTQCVRWLWSEYPSVVSASNADSFQIKNTGSGSNQAHLLFMNQNIQYWNGAATVDSTLDILLDWNVFCIIWNDTTNKIRYYINGSTTAEFSNASLQPIDQVYLRMGYGYDDTNTYSFVDTLDGSSTTAETQIVITEEEDIFDYDYYDPVLDEGICSSTPCAKLVNTPKYCYYDIATSSCTLDFQYNRWASGATAYLIAAGGLPPGYDSWYLVHNDGGSDNHLDVPNPGIATTSYYELYLDITDYGGYELGTYQVEWVSYCEIGNNCPGSPYYTSSRCNCDGIATSSLEFWDPTSYAGAFRYAVECGAVKAGCYLLTPDPNSYDYTIEQYSLMKEKFPFNLYTQMASSVKNMIGATSSVAVMTISGMPDSLSGLNGLNLLDLGTPLTSNAIYPLIQLIRSILLYLLKVFIPIYWILRIIALWKGVSFGGSMAQTEIEPERRPTVVEPRSNYVPRRGLAHLRSIVNGLKNK